MKKTVVATILIALIAGAMPCLAEYMQRLPLDYEILKSQLIVQGHIVGPNTVSVDRVLGGSTRRGDIVIVDRLSWLPTTAFDSIRSYIRVQTSYSFRRAMGEKVPELVRVNGDERFDGPLSMKGHKIVLFLYKERPSDKWSMYSGGSEVRWIAWGTVYGYGQPRRPGPFVLVPDPETRTPEKLYRAIADGVKKKARFDSAVSSKDPQKRIRGLLEFVQLGESARYFSEACWKLGETGLAAGPVLRRLADRPEYNSGERCMFIARLGTTHDTASVPYLLTVISKSEAVVKTCIGIPDYGKRTDKQHLAQGEWISALYALSSFKDSRVVPTLKEALILGIKIEDNQVPEMALRGLGNNPEVGNLTVIKEAIDLLSKKPSVNPPNSTVLGDIIQSLSQHKFPETVPILARLLANPDSQVRFDAHRGLEEIVKQDLGETEGPWLEWYDKSKAGNKGIGE